MPRKKNVPDPGDANIPAPVGERPYHPHLSAEEILEWQREFRRAHLKEARWHYIKIMLLIAPPRTRDDAMAVRLWFTRWREDWKGDFFDIGRLNKTTMLPTQEQLAVWEHTHEALVLASDRHEFRTLETNVIPIDDALAWAFKKGYDLPPEWLAEIRDSITVGDDVDSDAANEREADCEGRSDVGYMTAPELYKEMEDKRRFADSSGRNAAYRRVNEAKKRGDLEYFEKLGFRRENALEWLHNLKPYQSRSG